MKRKLSAFSIGLCIATTAYTLLYMSYGNPVKNSGALSKIGIEHKGLFVIWGVMTFLSLGLGIIIGYRKSLKTRAYIPLLCVGGLGMALTLCFEFDYGKMPDYYLHCAGSLTFSAAMGITVFLLFLLNYRKSVLCRVLAHLSAAILLADTICLLIFKETGLIEALPIFAGYIMLGIFNTRRERIELKA